MIKKMSYTTIVVGYMKGLCGNFRLNDGLCLSLQKCKIF